MLKSNSKAIKGLSIAIIVISAISILASIACVAGSKLVMNLISNETVKNEIVDSINNYSYQDQYDDKYDYDDIYDPDEAIHEYNFQIDNPDEFEDIMHIILTFFNIMLIAGAVLSVYKIIAAAISIKAANGKASLGVASGLTIGTIVMSVLCASVITLILSIILLVYIQKEKQYVQFAAQNNVVANASPVNPTTESTANTQVENTEQTNETIQE